MGEQHIRLMQDAADDKAFLTSSGKIKSLVGLRSALIMGGENFFRSYTLGENHFANWVEHVFMNKDLADRLRAAGSYEETLDVLSKRIDFAELWILHNEKDMAFQSYLEDKLIPMVGATNFVPEHHKFETVIDFNKLHLKPKEPERKLKPVPDLSTLSNQAVQEEPVEEKEESDYDPAAEEMKHEENTELLKRIESELQQQVERSKRKSFFTRLFRR